MALDGLILNKIIQHLEVLIDNRINKIYQITKSEIILFCHGKYGKQNLIISAHANNNRIQLSKEKYPTNTTPSQWIMVLRKHLENGFIKEIKQLEYDRHLTIIIKKNNDIGDETLRYLHIELMGKYGNIILCNEDNKIIDCLFKIPPFQNPTRIIQPGVFFIYPQSQNKNNPYTDAYNPNYTLSAQFSGISPLLDKEFEYRKTDYRSFIQEIQVSNQIYIYNLPQKTEFHLLPLTHLQTPFTKTLPIMEALDYIYHPAEISDLIKENTQDLKRFLKKEIKKLSNKLLKLQFNLEEASQLNDYRNLGETIYAYLDQIEKGKSEAIINDYQNNKITIPLDPRLSPQQNAQKYFKKYQKSKNGLIHIQTQIDKTKVDLKYFYDLQEQLSYASLVDALEIQDELINNGYFKNKVSRKNFKKNKKLNYKEIIYNSEISFFVGKNNLQNDYLTFKLAKKHYYWFHTKDFHGAHVIINTEKLTEDIIRKAAQIAAYYSAGKNSSSIPVDYTQIKNIKKIPNMKPGYVSIKNHKTIYIDIDQNTIESLTKIKN